MKYYKILSVEGGSCHGGHIQWPLPTEEGPGDWMPRIDSPVMCERGYHLCRRKDLIDWLNETIYEAEIMEGAETIIGGDKVVTSGPVRLTKRLPWDNHKARLLICDCVERAAFSWDDPRVWSAIKIARQFEAGSSTLQELLKTSEDIQYVVNTSLGIVPRAIASAAYESTASPATKFVRHALWSAAIAVRESAWNDSRIQTDGDNSITLRVSMVAWEAERSWQTDRLFEYLEGKR